MLENSKLMSACITILWHCFFFELKLPHNILLDWLPQLHAEKEKENLQFKTYFFLICLVVFVKLFSNYS